MIPGYHIDANHGHIVQSRALERKTPANKAISYPLLSFQRLELIKDVCGRPATLLDYGSPEFVLYCDTGGIQTTGCRISDAADPFIAYDVATLFDVFQLMTEDEQRDLLGTLVCKHLVLSVPWCHPELGAEWFAAWRHLKRDEHLSHWTSASLCSLLRIYNYRPIYVGNPEDAIRKVESEWWPNILTVILKRI